MDFSDIKKSDSQIYNLIKKEEERHQHTLNLIASENYASKSVREPLSSILVNKYSEGRPYKRYYGGLENIDKIETLAEERARKLFGISAKKWAVNVQSLSGSPANYAVYRGLLNLGDKIMSLPLSHGGHLTHGAKVSLSGIDFQVVNYFLDKKTNLLDYEEIKRVAIIEKPKLIICGYTAYPRRIDFKKFGEIAKNIGAYLMADISHIAGLVAAGAHPSPFPYVDVVTTTTHKTLRGPRGAIIFCREELREKIFAKVFPGMQGGPHNHTIASIAVALKEAASPRFKNYAGQIIKNSQALAKELKKYQFNLISGGTDNHLILIDLANKQISGKDAQNLLEKAGIVVNKNSVPYDARPAFDPSGIRVGTVALTTRGMREQEMKKVAFLMHRVISDPKSCSGVKKEIRKLCGKFPLK